jgi:hypothetical protein
VTPTFTLYRGPVGPDGACSILAHLGHAFAVAIERTYDAPPKTCCHQVAPGQWVKIPPGVYRAFREHYYRGGYMTFELEVPGHTDILVHRARWEGQLDGCIGVGESFHDFQHRPGIEGSEAGFTEFMVRAGDLQEFWLEVRDPAPSPVVVA